MRQTLSVLILALVGCAHAPLALAEDVVWGGDHIEMRLTAEGGTIEFDCAHGAVAEPIRPDAKGAFKVSGTFGAERPGPARDDGPADRKATYSGLVTGDVMTLTVVVEGADAQGTTYRLSRNRPGNVRKCR